MVGSPSIPASPFNTSHGSLDPLMDDVRRFFSFFWAAYDDRKWETGYKDDLPLVKRAARMSVVECDEIIMILSWPSHMTGPTGRHGHSYPRDQYPDLTEMGDVSEIAQSLYLGEVIDYKPFPLQYDRIEANRQDSAEGRDERNFKATASVKEAAETWARELADEHMARTHPDFEDARQRMTAAYGKLFELEHTLRGFIESTLQSRFKKDWWNQVLEAFNTETVELIKKRQSQARHTWLDDFNTSRTRFLDFDHYRQIILKHKGVFTSAVPDVKELTDLLRDLVPMRHRIGHVNTLTADNYEDFIRMSNRIIAIVWPRPES